MAGGSRAERRHDIDFIRVLVFGLVIILHSSMIYGTRSWLIHADISNRAFDFIYVATHPWRISLLFLISGITTASLCQRMQPVDIRSMRTRQLVPPLLFGVFVLVPPQIYVAATTKLGVTMSYLDFWVTYLRCGTITDATGVEHNVMGMEHLWFLAYLWLYTAILTAFIRYRPDLTAAMSARLTRLLGNNGLLLWPIVYLAAMRLALYPIFGETMQPHNDWYAHIVYLSFFVFGFLIAESAPFWANVVERRFMSTAVACSALLVLAILFASHQPGEAGPMVVTTRRLVRSILQWSTILAVLGHCRVMITRPNPVITYLNKAVMTYYVLHQTIIVLIAFWLRQAYDLSGWSFLLVVAAAIGVCMVAYEIHRRCVYWLPLVRRIA